MGAAVATMISYLAMWIMKHIKVTKIINLNVNIIKITISYILLIMQSILYITIGDTVIKHIAALAIFTILVIANFNEIKALLIDAKSILNNFKQKKLEG